MSSQYSGSDGDRSPNAAQPQHPHVDGQSLDVPSKDSPTDDAASRPADSQTMAAILSWGLNGGSELSEQEVRSAATSQQPTLRRIGTHALTRRGAATGQDVARWAADPDPTNRIHLAEMLGRYPLPDALETAQRLLADPEPLVAETAAWSLGEIDDEATSVALLIDAAENHDDALVRESAVAALGAIGDPAAKEAILKACSDKPAVRRRAVLALAAFEGPDVEAALNAALSDRDWQVRQAAEDLLG
ncbi:MAG: HEAT repeat domain-containing protein [Acidimicrobiia bacterium]|nr:HEAT repeat domain-containing protein [Acidimicrobiia bacterium]